MTGINCRRSSIARGKRYPTTVPSRSLSFNEDFRDVLLELADGDVRFLVVGAFAVALHGAPRATGDMDVLVSTSSSNARKVYEALRRFGAPLDAAGVVPEDFEKPGTVYQIGLPPRRIDVLTQITAVGFEDAWTSRVVTELEGRAVPFIGREELLRNKEAAGRPKDVVDVAALRKR